MASNTALRLDSTSVQHAFTPRRRLWLVRNRRDCGVSETDVFSMLNAKEEECCDRATD